jgi:exonuclease VII large subunit
MRFAVAVKKFFGMKDGQTLQDFVAEVRGLTPADRAEMAPQLSVALGEEVTAE